jgi:arylsulfatase A-like enzyme
LGDEAQPPHHYSYWQPSAATPDVVTAQAAQFLAQQTAGKPFLLTIGYSQAADAVPQKYLDAVAQTKFDTVNYEPVAATARDQEKFRATLTHIRRAAAALAWLDDQIPLVLEALSQRGVLDQTLVIFTSANGALLGRHGLWGDGAASEPVNFYEESVALPMIWRWPEHIPPASVRPEDVSATDLMPSLLELAGATAPGRNLTGRSYVTPAMSRPLPKKQPWRTQVFAALGSATMVREGRFKLVLRGVNGPHELFDEGSGTTEKVNQYANLQYVTVRDRLAAAIAAWWGQSGSSVPLR